MFICQMQNTVVLDVRVVPHDDPIDISPQDGVEPDARVLPYSHIAQQHGPTGNENLTPKDRTFFQELVQLLLELCHSQWGDALSF
jgi:hypothetical protein